MVVQNRQDQYQIARKILDSTPKNTMSSSRFPHRNDTICPGFGMEPFFVFFFGGADQRDPRILMVYLHPCHAIWNAGTPFLGGLGLTHLDK